MKIDQPGIYAIPAAQYHADPAPAPSLSSSIARELIMSSAHHAWWNHPKLNAAYQREENEHFDLGSAAHAFLLEGETNFVIVPGLDWKKKEAQEARAAARKNGKIALLAHQWVDLQAMVKAANQQLELHQDPPRPLAVGKPERTLIWKEAGDIWCRARLDWLHESGLFIDDYKSTGASANPEAWTRGPLFNMGHDVQAAFYLRGYRAVFDVDATWRFVVQENYPPFALSVIGMTPATLDLANRKVEYALRLWRECIERDRWPGYPQVTCYAEPPPWELARWEAQEMGMAPPPPQVDDGRPLADQLFGER